MEFDRYDVATPRSSGRSPGRTAGRASGRRKPGPSRGSDGFYAFKEPRRFGEPSSATAAALEQSMTSSVSRRSVSGFSSPIFKHGTIS